MGRDGGRGAAAQCRHVFASEWWFPGRVRRVPAWRSRTGFLAAAAVAHTEREVGRRGGDAGCGTVCGKAAGADGGAVRQQQRLMSSGLGESWQEQCCREPCSGKERIDGLATPACKNQSFGCQHRSHVGNIGVRTRGTADGFLPGSMRQAHVPALGGKIAYFSLCRRPSVLSTACGCATLGAAAGC
jgi:hypothetical protein